MLPDNVEASDLRRMNEALFHCYRSRMTEADRKEVGVYLWANEQGLAMDMLLQIAEEIREQQKNC